MKTEKGSHRTSKTKIYTAGDMHRGQSLVVWAIAEGREAAKEAEQRKNDMLVYMAHDLKTPLTSVLGYLSLLKEEHNVSTELRIIRVVILTIFKAMLCNVPIFLQNFLKNV